MNALNQNTPTLIKQSVKEFFLGIILCLLCSFPLYSQESDTIYGYVTNISGDPVEGVAISLEGVSGLPEVTNSEGEFSLLSSRKNAWILVEPADGYKPKRIYLNNRKVLRITLTPDDLESTDDKVGQFYGSAIRKNIISSNQTLETDNILYQKNQLIDHSLQNKISGLWSVQQSGTPLGGVTSFLRGIRSLNTTGQPLYIIDGLPMEDFDLFQSNIQGFTYNPLSSLHAMDITSVSVYKDYMESTIHGLRASNGVVLIETLKPDQVTTTIDFSFRTGISMSPSTIPQLNSDQYKSLANEILSSSGKPEEDYILEYFPLYATEDHEQYFKYNKNINWQDEIFRNATFNDVYLRVMGGDEIARYGLSVSYLTHNGILKNTRANRFNVRFVGTFNIFEWMRMYINTNLSNSDHNSLESGLGDNTSPITASLWKAPILNPYEYDDNGNELQTLENVNSLGVSNPVAIVNSFIGNQKNNRFATSFKLEADIIGNTLQWVSTVGLNFNTLNENVFLPNRGMELYYNNEAYNVAKSLKNYLFAFHSDNYLSFTREFNQNHALSGIAGVRISQNRFQIDYGIAKNSHESDEYRQLQNGTSFLREMGGENANWNRMAAYSEWGYAYRNKYLLRANVITEYSSRIGRNADDILLINNIPFGLFYSAGAGWRISSEPFLKNLSWLEEFKLRITYGVAGNDDIGNLNSLDYYTTDHYRETTAMIPGSISDQTLSYETNYQWNTGLDLRLFGSRISFMMDFYQNRTENLLVFEPQPPFLGFNIIPVNNGTVLNKGWEAQSFIRIINGRKLKWDVSMNLSNITNEVEKISDGEVVTPINGGYLISKVGNPVMSFYGLNFLGVYSSEEEAAAEGLVNKRGTPFGAGDARYEDVSGPEGKPDGVINENDRIILGSPIPNLIGGFHSRLQFGRWSLQGSVQFVSGNEVFNWVRYQNEKMTGLENQSTNTLSRWVQPGQITNVPRASYNDPVGNSDFSSRWIEDGSYFRFKELTLAYTIPAKIGFLRNLEVFLTAENFLTISKYLGYDPEFSYSYYIQEQGIDYGLMPVTASYLMGIKIGL